MRRGPWLFVGCYAASGTAALIYEVAWTRLFTLELGHTVAASSTVLAAFMGGLALERGSPADFRPGLSAVFKPMRPSRSSSRFSPLFSQ